jgi:single-strand DNA-binding protein
MQNIVILAGNIGQSPEVRTTQGGAKITNFTLATSRPRLAEGRVQRAENGYRVMDTEWHRITCFNGLGKTVADNCEKGMKVLVHGRIHYTKWTDAAGSHWFPILAGKSSVVWKQDRLDVHRAIQHMQDNGPALSNAIEDQIPAMHPTANAMMFVPWDDRPGLRHVREFQAAAGKLPHETQGPRRIVLSDVVTDRLKVSFCRSCKLDNHSAGRPMA